MVAGVPGGPRIFGWRRCEGLVIAVTGQMDREERGASPCGDTQAAAAEGGSELASGADDRDE